MKLVFFGTPDFAVPTLAALVADGRAVDLVVSQPARPKGRGRRLAEPPVAAWARNQGLEVVQPERVRSAAFMDRLAALAPDVAVVVAFGQIFRQPLLDLPRLGCINVHASLLPRWRGAAPIQAAITQGDAETGVTTMRMEAGLDSGPMLLRAATPIGPHETAPELSARLADLGARLMVDTLAGLERGDLHPQGQDDAAVTLAPRLTKADAAVDWRRSASSLYARWRGQTPWPGLVATQGDRALKLVAVRSVPHGVADAPPGTVVGCAQGGVEVACGEGSVLRLERVQRPGRQAVPADAWYHGEQIQSGAAFVVAP